MSLEFNNI